MKNNIYKNLINQKLKKFKLNNPKINIFKGKIF